MEIKKLVKDGKVAVIVSPGHGAGWSTSNSECVEQMVFDPALANMLLAENSFEDVEHYANKKYPEAYLGGLTQAEVQWVNVGDRFYIDEYDGYESVEILTPEYGYTA